MIMSGRDARGPEEHDPSVAADGDTSYEDGAVTRPIFSASWCAPGVLGVSPAKLGRRMI
jgi:hypothetical protein